jgi:hypothetical protein
MKPILKRHFVQFLAIALIVLVFLSKVSFKWLGVPYQMSFLIYQHGIHPYAHFALCAFFGIPLLVTWLVARNQQDLAPPYLIYVGVLVAVLCIQTIFQILYVNPYVSAIFQLQGLALTVFMILIYGVIIPTVLPLTMFGKTVRYTTQFLILASFLLLIAFGGGFFRGGRFVGIFKHIPHMVVCASVALIFMLPTFYHPREQSILQKSYKTLLIFMACIAIVLTATKAAVLVMLMVFLVAGAFLARPNLLMQIGRMTFVLLMSSILVFYGHDIYNFGYEVVTGARSFMDRPALDGVQSRLDEVYRGAEYFRKNMAFGKGILFRFMGGSKDVSSYDADQDRRHSTFDPRGFWTFFNGGRRLQRFAPTQRQHANAWFVSFGASAGFHDLSHPLIPRRHGRPHLLARFWLFSRALARKTSRYTNP